MQNTLSQNTPSLWQHALPTPKQDGNKYDKGHVLVCGSPLQGSGATKLVALSALRTGAGLVSVACDKTSLPIYALAFTAIMAKLVPNTRTLLNLISKHKINVVAVGSGNGVGKKTRSTTLTLLKQNHLACVLDADIFTSFAGMQNKLIKNLHKNCILTPHEGEFARLFPNIKGDRPARAKQAAQEANCCVVLKGHHTVIATYDGQFCINNNAPSSLATAGTGDVLAGVIAGLLAQKMPPFFAASAGVYLHSLCAQNLGSGLIAEDLPNQIPTARKMVQETF